MNAPLPPAQWAGFCEGLAAKWNDGGRTPLLAELPPIEVETQCIEWVSQHGGDLKVLAPPELRPWLLARALAAGTWCRFAPQFLETLPPMDMRQVAIFLLVKVWHEGLRDKWPATAQFLLAAGK